MAKFINIVKAAAENGFAIPAFNYTDIWEYLAIKEAADELKAPVYAASAKITVEALGLDFCGAIGTAGFNVTNGNLYNHLDHCTDVNRCNLAVDAGYQSVMFDGSALDLNENISLTKQVVAYARAKGVFVEAEVGQILGRSDEGSLSQIAHTVSIDDCVRMATETGITSLAIGIGNQHGFYKAKPNLNIGLLREVHKLIDIPLVLHGSTGLEDDVVKECIANGIAKVNVGTALHHAYKTTLAVVVPKDPEKVAVTTFAFPAKEAIKEVCKRWIRLCGAEGKRFD